MPCAELLLTDRKADQAEFRRQLLATIDAVAKAMESSKAYAGMLPRDLERYLHEEELLPEHGLGFDEVLRRTAEKVLPNMLHPSSQNYMAHLHSPVLLESIAAELIITAFNQSMDSWDQSPAATEIEVDTIRHLCRLYGFGEGADGVFTSGGSQSNLTGILLARDRFCREKFGCDVQKHGLPEQYRKLRLYTSEISHFSMEKSAHLLGLGYDAVVKVPVDSAQKMDVEALKRLIEEDVRNGNIPFCVVATEGTTDYGSIDPIPEIRKVCDRYGMRLHADAAYGSGVVLSKKYASRVEGLSLCDSLTVDFHKMFLLPISCSAILFKDGTDFRPLEYHADYLNREEDEEDGYTNLVGKSIQTTRRFDALKVWISFQVRGKDGWDQLISGCIENAAYLYEQLAARPEFETTTVPEITSVVFRVKDSDEVNRKIRRALIHQCGVVIGQTVFQGQVCLKCTLLNPELTRESLDSLLELILRLRDQVKQ